MQKKTILMILDGWGIAANPAVSAIDQAHTPYIDQLYKDFPNATLRTDGLQVGLPEGQMGNSEVGHLNLGAGRIVYQQLTRINLAIQNGTFQEEKTIREAFDYAKKNQKKVHLLGLLSDGGVHAHSDHVKGILDAAAKFGLEQVYLHAFTDGRDVDPQSGLEHIRDIQEFMSKTTGKLASVIGRYYAMDRDNRWERVKLAYDLLVKGKGNPTFDILKTIQQNYDQGTSDEFIKPIVLHENNRAVATITADDVVLFFNFRTDRGRELTTMLSQKNMSDFRTQKIPLHFVTMTNYDPTFKDIKVIYEKENIHDTLGEVLSKSGKKQIRIAETEKYPHVTFFFSGGREAPFEGEQRILKNSPKVATYDLKPEMSAFELKAALLPELEKGAVDFVCLNFANGDMVGHTGMLEAAKKACETIDQCVREVTTAALANGYSSLIIADHGNCETMQQADGSPHTAHTTNPVPFILVDPNKTEVKDGILADIAPTILDLMSIPKPIEMTGNSLLC